MDGTSVEVEIRNRSDTNLETTGAAIAQHRGRSADMEPEVEPETEGRRGKKKEATRELDNTYSQDSLMQGIETPDRQVRTRIFFTSESHVHALLNVLRLGTTRDGQPLLDTEALAALGSTAELNFLTHYVFKVRLLAWPVCVCSPACLLARWLACSLAQLRARFALHISLSLQSQVFERPRDGTFRAELHFSAGSNESPMDYNTSPTGTPKVAPSPPRHPLHLHKSIFHTVYEQAPLSHSTCSLHSLGE